MRRFPLSPRTRQSGFSLLEVLLAVTVAIALGSLQLSKIRSETETMQAQAVGQQLAMVGNGLNTYITLQYNNIVNMTNAADPGTANDPGPRTCDSTAKRCTVTSATLQRMGLLPHSFSGVNAFGSNYEFYIRVQGSAPNWQVDGVVLTSDPYQVGGVVRYDLIGQAMYKAGADSGATRASLNRIDGLNGTWNETDFPTTQLGQLAYRAGYGTSNYSAYLRLDGTTPMTGDFDVGGHNIVNANNITATGDVTASRLRTNAPSSDGIVLGSTGAADPNDPNKTQLGNGGNALVVRNEGGVRFINAAANGTPLLAGNASLTSVTASGTGSFAGALQAKGITSTGGANIASTGQITSVSDIVSGGNFRTSDGLFTASNGNISASNNISAGSLIVSGNASIGNNLQMNANGAGWYYTSGNNLMTLGNNADLRVGGKVQAATVKSDGILEAGSFLQIDGQQGVGAACTVGQYARDVQGRILQCIGGAFVLAGGVNNVTVVNGGVASAGSTSTAICPGGTKMVGGGYFLVYKATFQDPSAPEQSFGNPSQNGWVAVAGTGHQSQFQAQAVCVN